MGARALVIVALTAGAVACAAREERPPRGDQQDTAAAPQTPPPRDTRVGDVAMADAAVEPDAVGVDAPRADTAPVDARHESPDGRVDAQDAATDAAVVADGAARADAGVPAVACGDPALFVCDDFETYAAAALPGSPWEARGGRPVVTTAKAASGTKAIVTKNGQGLRYRFATDKRPDVVYGRVMFWAEETPFDHWSFILAEMRSGHLFRLGQQRKYGKQLMTNYGWPGGERENISSTDKFPLKRWACFEWSFDRVQKISNLWVDGMLIAKASGKLAFGPAVPGPWEWVDVGQATFHAEAQTTTIYMDDLAIGTKRVGCPTP